MDVFWDNPIHLWLFEVSGLRVRLHAVICCVRFIFWHMRNTADATIRLVQVVILDATYSRVFTQLL